MFVTAAFAPEALKYVAPHQEISRTFRTRTETTRVIHTHSDHVPAVQNCPVAQKCITPSESRSAAPPRALTLPPNHAASIDTQASKLAPPIRSYAPSSIIQPPTFTGAASRTIEPREQRPLSFKLSKHVSTRSPSHCASNAPRDPAQVLFSASTLVPTLSPPSTSPPPRISFNKAAHRFHRRRSRCVSRLVRAHRFYSPRKSSFAAPHSSVSPLIHYTSRRLDASYTRP